METKESIYTSIVKHINADGRLPSSFTLVDDTPQNELRFMPGAKDGIGIFHTAMDTKNDQIEEIRRLCDLIWKKDIKSTSNPQQQHAKDRISSLLKEHGTLSIIDPLLEAITKNSASIDVDKLIAYASELAFESAEKESVKLGIALLGLLTLSNATDIIKKLLTLASYEEFTLFVIVALSNCEDANDYIFKIAQRVDGWGKIHAVERLEPATPEIRDWLLREGCENNIMDAYLGYECATKGNIIKALRKKDLDTAHFEGISHIILALLEEGPCDGISIYPHAQEALSLYLEAAKVHTTTIKQLWYVFNIQDWLRECELTEKQKLLIQCECILKEQDWNPQILSSVSQPEDPFFYYAVDCANRLSIDISEPLLQAVKAMPLKHYAYLPQLFEHSDYAKELTALYENTLPLDQMEKGMGDILFSTTYQNEHNCLAFILQELAYYPNMGKRLVSNALQSPVCSVRHSAISVLEAWCASTQKPLSKISHELTRLVTDILPIEVNEGYKKRMEALPL